MNYRLNTAAIAGAVLLVVVATVLFIYTLLSAPHEEDSRVTHEALSQMEADMIISGKHQYVDGMHTIVGTIPVDTPCRSIIVEPFFTNDVPDHLHVELQFTTILEGGEACVTEPSNASYRVTFEASEQVTISGTWNGVSARLNLVPVAEGELIDTPSDLKG